jgi:hypothetical protein
VPTEISTSFVERSNLSIRIASRRFTRLTNGFSKKLDNYCAAVSLYVAHSGGTQDRAAARGHCLPLTKDWSDEGTDNPYLAHDRNFYKVEKRIKHGTKLDRLLYAGNNLEKARDVFASAIRHQPRIRLTIRQRTRVLFQWPEE